MSEQQQETQQQSQQSDGNKEAKKFEANRRRLIAVLGGDALLKRTKVDGDSFRELIGELIGDKKKEKVATVKKEITSLMEEYIAFMAFEKKTKAEMEKTIEAKHKEFNAKANAIYAMIEGIEEMEREYYAALRGASGAPAETTSPNPEN